MKKKYLNELYCLALVLLTGPTLAGDFDGSKPLICALHEVIECWPGAGCENVRPEDINQPRIIRIDFKEHTISGKLAGSKVAVSTPIDLALKFENGLLMHGIEGPHAWSATVIADSGHMVMAFPAAQLSITMFGTCIPQ